MTVCSDIADYEWLTGDEACGLLNELSDDAGPLHATVERLRRTLSRERAHLLIEQLDLRRCAAAKFTHPERMFFTRLGLEQATDQWIAAHKALRFTQQRAGSSPTPAFADLCCGIGGDLVALAGQGTVVGVDRDAVTAHFAAVNSGAAVRCVDAIDFHLCDFSTWHIDPDRRPTGRRTTSLDHCRPDIAAIERLLAQVPHAAVKLAPAAKVPADWSERCELEWISRDRECRQLVAWHGELAHSPAMHRATVIQKNSPPRSGEEPGEGKFARTLIGRPNQPIDICDKVDRYVFDIDPAVLAAGLKGALAAQHNLSALAPGPTYLTGPRPLDDPALTCFEALDVLPMQLRQLAAYLRERNLGQLEIKKRGVDIDPETLRRDLKLHGNSAATLLITRITRRPTAILARRYSPHPPSAKIDRST